MTIDLPNRHSIRLPGFDYSQPYLYFVTICAYHRECLFGDVIDGKMQINNIGLLINENWNKLTDKFPIELYEYVVMPNHMHGIIVIKPNSVGVSFMKPDKQMAILKSNHHMGLINQTPTLGQIIRHFKSKCTYEIHKNELNNYIWQRNFYEHIIRTENDLIKIREYILTNPLMWNRDRNNPKFICRGNKY